MYVFLVVQVFVYLQNCKATGNPTLTYKKLSECDLDLFDFCDLI